MIKAIGTRRLFLAGCHARLRVCVNIPVVRRESTLPSPPPPPPPSFLPLSDKSNSPLLFHPSPSPPQKKPLVALFPHLRRGRTPPPADCGLGSESCSCRLYCFQVIAAQPASKKNKASSSENYKNSMERVSSFLLLLPLSPQPLSLSLSFTSSLYLLKRGRERDRRRRRRRRTK